MSDLTTIATGILPASGYKAGTVYGIVPTNDNTTGIAKTAFDFTSTRNGPAYRTNENGVLEEMSNDVCRVEYPTCPSLLLEPASTNLFLNSDVAVDQIIAGLTVSQAYTITFYEGEGDIDISSIGGGPTQAGVPFTFNASSNSHFFTINGTCNKVQLEHLGYATSYISTLGTSVTRPQDALEQAVPNSDMYNSEEGVLMVDAFVNNIDSQPNISLSNGSTAETFRFSYNYLVPTRLQAIFRSDSSSLNLTLNYTGDLQSFMKIAFRYKLNDFSLWVNGSNVAESLTGNVPTSGTFDRVRFDRGNGTLDYFGKCKSVAYFPSFLTDEEMAQLTT